MAVNLTDNAGDEIRFDLENLYAIRETFPQLFGPALSDENISEMLTQRSDYLTRRYFPGLKFDDSSRTHRNHGVALSILQAAILEVPEFWAWFRERIEDNPPDSGDVL